MPKITVTFDIPEKTKSLFQEYGNVPTYQLTQHDQYAIRDLLEETLDRNAIDYKNPTENALIGLLSTVIDQQRPDDKRSFPEFVIDYIYDDIEDDDNINTETIEYYFNNALANGTMTMSTQKSINYLASFWQDIEIYDELYQNVFVNAFKEPDVFLIQVSTEMAKQIVDAFQDLTGKNHFTGQEFKDLIDQYDDRTKGINPLNDLIWASPKKRQKMGGHHG
jgi:hypothetical protein